MKVAKVSGFRVRATSNIHCMLPVVRRRDAIAGITCTGLGNSAYAPLLLAEKKIKKNKRKYGLGEVATPLRISGNAQICAHQQHLQQQHLRQQHQQQQQRSPQRHYFN